MATNPVLSTQSGEIAISPNLRVLLHLEETETHYVVRTFSGAALFRPKADIKYPFHLLQGIMDDGKDTGEERKRERDGELAHDEQKFGSHHLC